MNAAAAMIAEEQPEVIDFIKQGICIFEDIYEEIK